MSLDRVLARHAPRHRAPVHTWRTAGLWLAAVAGFCTYSVLLGLLGGLWTVART